MEHYAFFAKACNDFWWKLLYKALAMEETHKKQALQLVVARNKHKIHQQNASRCWNNNSVFLSTIKLCIHRLRKKTQSVEIAPTRKAVCDCSYTRASVASPYHPQTFLLKLFVFYDSAYCIDVVFGLNSKTRSFSKNV
jgi:hypothetical protein